MFIGRERRLEDIADLGTGTTPSRSNPDYFGGSINWVLTAEVDNNEINATSETLTEKALADYALRVYPENTVLLAMYGQGQTRGKAAYLNCSAAVTQNCAAIITNAAEVLPKYLFYFLRSRYAEIRNQEYSGGGVPHLNLKIVSGIMVPVPSVEEQAAIVATIESEIAVLLKLEEQEKNIQSRIQSLIGSIWGRDAEE